MSLEDFIKGQCCISNFCFSEVLGSIWIKVAECMNCSQNGYDFLVLIINNDNHIRKFPRFQ